MFIRGIRETERRSFLQMRLMLQISGHFTPRQLRNRPNVRDPHYEEDAIPARLQNFLHIWAPCRLSPIRTRTCATPSSWSWRAGEARFRHTRRSMRLNWLALPGLSCPANTRLMPNGGGITLDRQSARMRRMLFRCRLGCCTRFASC